MQDFDGSELVQTSLSVGGSGGANIEEVPRTETQWLFSAPPPRSVAEGLGRRGLLC